MQIIVDKGTILGTILAVIFAVIGGYIGFVAAVAIMWGKEKTELITTVLTWAGLLVSGWVGWTLGHWFCS